MPIRNLATVAVAIFLGLVAVILVRTYLDQAVSVNAPAPVVATVPVVVAAQAVARGAVLQPELLKVVNFPQDSVPEGAFQNLAQITGAQDVQRMALRSLVANEPILPGKISGPGSNLNLALEITAGMRAVSLRADDVLGVGGFVLPGDRVDVQLTRSVGPEEANKATQVLAENIRVLGVDQSSDDEADKPVVVKAVTIEVTPDQAQAIALGQSVGVVSMALRRVADVAPLVRRATIVRDLSRDLPRPPPAPRAPPQTEVRVTRGVDVSLYRGGENSLAPVVSEALRGVAAAVPGVVTPGVVTP